MKIPQRDAEIVLDGYIMEMKGYGRLAGSSLLSDLLLMAKTFGLRPDSSQLLVYRHVRWYDGQEWTKRIDPAERDHRLRDRFRIAS